MKRFALPVIWLIVCVFSLYSPLGDITATPKFWRDEAITFEVARSLAEAGVADVFVAPNMPNGLPYLTHATGFAVTYPLALLFKIFGVSVFLARVYMIAWLFVAVTAVYFFLKKIFHENTAFVGTVFVATFSSLYANGRTLTGEIPGFVFLLIGLYLLYGRKKLFFAGVLMALAATTKPSIYLLIFPAVFVELLIRSRREMFKKLITFGLGALPVFFLWIYIILPKPLRIESWRGMIDLYRSPFHDPSVISQGASLFLHPTIIYFALITLIIIFASRRGLLSAGEGVVRFSPLYGVAAFIYFLRSPGWLRFLVAYEILALMLVAAAIIGMTAKNRWALTVFVLAIVLVQGFVYFFRSHIPSGTASLEIGQFLNKELLTNNDFTIGFLYLPTIAPLVPSGRRYQVGEIGGSLEYGKNPLGLPSEKLPTFVVSYNNEYGKYKNILEEYYKSQPRAEIRDLKIFEKK